MTRLHWSMFKQFVFGIGPGDPALDLPRSRLIYPLSKFGVFWLSITAIFLIYTGIVTAPLVAFYWTEPECSMVPTLYLDTAIDIFFIIDIFLNFHFGIFEGGKYIDDAWIVFWTYIRGSLIFDMVTSFPVSFFELVAQTACNSGQAPADSGPLRLVRAIKPLRLIKIVRLAKVGKAGPLIARLADAWDITPIAGKNLKLMVSLVLSIHLVACVWWFWKVQFMTRDELDAFLDAQPWGKYERNSINTDMGKVEAYIISVYIATMTLTTVGYGDIGADNTGERVGYIVLFIVGAFIWGELMATMGEIHSAACARDQERMEQVQDVVEFLHSNECPKKLRLQIVSWTRFAEDHKDENMIKQKVIADLPMYLKKELVRHLYQRQYARRVPVFSLLTSLDPAVCPDAQDVMDEIFLAAFYETFAPGETIVRMIDVPDRLIIIESGKVDVEFSHPTRDHPPMVLKDGDFFGDMVLLGETDWASSTCFGISPEAPQEDAEANGAALNTEISVVSCPNEFVVVLILKAESFRRSIVKASVSLQGEMQDYLGRWTTSRERFARSSSLTRAGNPISIKVVVSWEGMAFALLAHNKLNGPKEGEGGGGGVQFKLKKKGRIMDWAKEDAERMSEELVEHVGKDVDRSEGEGGEGGGGRGDGGVGVAVERLQACVDGISSTLSSAVGRLERLEQMNSSAVCLLEQMQDSIDRQAADAGDRLTRIEKALMESADKTASSSNASMIHPDRMLLERRPEQMMASPRNGEPAPRQGRSREPSQRSLNRVRAMVLERRDKQMMAFPRNSEPAPRQGRSREPSQRSLKSRRSTARSMSGCSEANSVAAKDATPGQPFFTSQLYNVSPNVDVDRPQSNNSILRMSPPVSADSPLNGPRGVVSAELLAFPKPAMSVLMHPGPPHRRTGQEQHRRTGQEQNAAVREHDLEAVK